MRTVAFWLVASLVFTFPTEDMLHISDGFGSVSRAVGMVATLFWLLTVCITNRIRKVHLVHVALAMYVLWNAVSLFWSADVGRTVPRIVCYAQLLVLSFILWDVCRTPAAMRIALQAYVCGTYLALGSQFYNYAYGIADLEFSRHRFTATGVHPNSIGLILALSIAIAWYLAITSTGTSKTARLLRYLNYAYIPTAYYGIVLTASRGSLLASVPAAMYILWTLRDRQTRGNSFVVAGLIIVMCCLLPMAPQHLIERLGETGDEIAAGDLNGRVALWEAGIVSFFERPFLGVGASAFRTVNRIGAAAHNSFISILVDLGLIGLVLFAGALAVVLYQAIRTRPPEMWFWLALLAIWFVGQMGHNWEHTKHTWLVLSMVAIAGNLSGRQPRSDRHPDLALT